MQTRTKINSNLALSVVILVLANFVFVGCEKIINVNLVDAPPQLVIEGMITDSVGPYLIKISRSGSYFNQPVLPPVSDAVVVISDNVGTIDTLKETVPGYYRTSKVQGIPGRTYSLVVLSGNTRYTGSSTMSNPVAIDSLTLEKSHSPGILSNDIRVEIYCYFIDPLEKNYYRTFVYTGDHPGYEDYKLYDDQYANGEKTNLQVKRAHVGDKIRVDLMSLDKYTYEYYRMLNDLLHSNPIFGSTPVNPNTNLTNGALGYFGACAISTKTILITQSLFNSAK